MGRPAWSEDATPKEKFRWDCVFGVLVLSHWRLGRLNQPGYVSMPCRSLVPAALFFVFHTFSFI